MDLSLASLLTASACLFALACGADGSPARATAPAASTADVAPLAATDPVSPPARQPAAAPPRDARPAEHACIEVDAELGGTHVVLEGRIFIDDAHEHPTRGKTRPIILRLDAPRCAIGIEEPRITEVQLAASEDVALKPLVGRRVRVAGDPFAAHTAWHARPIVLMTTTAKPLD